MRIKFKSGLLVGTVILIFLTGCLTSEYKEYRFKVNRDGSGTGEIKYINILSEKDEGEDVSYNDFGELIDDYLNGDIFENDNPYFNVIHKELYEENNQLMGLVKFNFSSLDSSYFHIFKECDCAPIMYYLGSLSETLEDTNGEYLGTNRDFPVILWDKNTSELYFKTVVQDDLSETSSLLPLYNTWLESQEEE